ncbi:hypothetical protein SAMN05216522_12211 [Rosenbergiella nectarea]|uniref:Uncharacterized protein n=1 Tax=Rosenbergiella nectarea TaxID=988801 RepID=A0A1H9N466_9GAMM|nr:hypothetical protein SAMN05216522_12211 [Rosenbergiella nectarea]
MVSMKLASWRGKMKNKVSDILPKYQLLIGPDNAFFCHRVSDMLDVYMNYIALHLCPMIFKKILCNKFTR